MQTVLSRLTVSQAVGAEARSLSPNQTLSEVVTVVLHAFQEDFPVVDGAEIVGVLTRTNLIGGLHSLGPAGRVSKAMGRSFPVVAAKGLC